MTKYEIGDRVHVVSVDEINGLSHLMPLGAEGVVTEVSGRARVESGGQLWWVEDEHIELITTDIDATEARLADAWEAGWYARHNYDERGGEPPPVNPYEADQ